MFVDAMPLKNRTISFVTILLLFWGAVYFVSPIQGQLPSNTTWTAPSSFGDVVTSGISPHLASSGNTWVSVFSAKNLDSADYEIMFSRSDDGTSWTVPAPLNIDWEIEITDDFNACVSGGLNGIWIVIWERRYDITVSRSIDNGYTWSEPVQIGSGAYPSITYLGEAEWLSAWRQTDLHLRRTLDGGLTWLDRKNLPARLTVDRCGNTHPCRQYTFSNPVISGSHRFDTVILGVDIVEELRPEGYSRPAIYRYYEGGLLSSFRGYSFPVAEDTYPSVWETPVFESSKTIKITGSGTNYIAAVGRTFSGRNFFGNYISFTHPASTIGGTSRVAISELGHIMGLSIAKVASESSETQTSLIATLSKNHGALWEPTHVIDTSEIFEFGTIQQAELECSATGQFITVYQAVDQDGSATIWYSTLNRFIIDSDNDGVPDEIDLCPETSSTEMIDPHGCPIPDGDRDGVADEFDLCPHTPEGETVDERGCAPDGDRDGVSDKTDLCPGTAPGEIVDLNGCLLDSDGDGVRDTIDQCNNTPAGEPVDHNGCTLPDIDGDGVINGLDFCRDTPEGDVVDANGCSILQNCPCEGPREGGLYKNKKGQKKCLKQQAKELVKEGRLTKKERKALLKQYKQIPCEPPAVR